MLGSSSGLAGVIATWTRGASSDGCRVLSEAVAAGSPMSIGGCGDSRLILLVGRAGKGGGVVSADAGVTVMACGNGGGFRGGRRGGWDIFPVAKHLEGLGMEKSTAELCL